MQHQLLALKNVHNHFSSKTGKLKQIWGRHAVRTTWFCLKPMLSISTLNNPLSWNLWNLRKTIGFKTYLMENESNRISFWIILNLLFWLIKKLKSIRIWINYIYWQFLRRHQFILYENLLQNICRCSNQCLKKLMKLWIKDMV